MIDWIQEHAWASWLGAAVILAAVELLSLDLVLLMFAIGALAAAFIAAVGGPPLLAIAVFAVVSLLLLLVVRPSVVAKLHAGPTLETGHSNLIGRTAIVLEPVTKSNGRVQLAGELWSARTAEPDDVFVPGIEVIVIQIDGATAVLTHASPSASKES